MDASIAVLLLLANQPNQLRYPIAHLIRWRRMRTQFCDETCTEWHHPFKNWIAYPAACDANIVGCNFDGQIVRSAEQNTHFQYHLLTNSLFVILFFLHSEFCRPNLYLCLCYSMHVKVILKKKTDGDGERKSEKKIDLEIARTRSNAYTWNVWFRFTSQCAQRTLQSRTLENRRENVRLENQLAWICWSHESIRSSNSQFSILIWCPAQIIDSK